MRKAADEGNKRENGQEARGGAESRDVTAGWRVREGEEEDEEEGSPAHFPLVPHDGANHQQRQQQQQEQGHRDGGGVCVRKETRVGGWRQSEARNS